MSSIRAEFNYVVFTYYLNFAVLKNKIKNFCNSNSIMANSNNNNCRERYQNSSDTTLCAVWYLFFILAGLFTNPCNCILLFRVCQRMQLLCKFEQNVHSVYYSVHFIFGIWSKRNFSSKLLLFFRMLICGRSLSPQYIAACRCARQSQAMKGGKKSTTTHQPNNLQTEQK